MTVLHNPHARPPATVVPASHTPAPMPVLVSGLDFGQAADYSALATVERTIGPDPIHPGRSANLYSCRLLHRWQLGTSYTDIIASLVEMYGEAPFAGTAIGADYTGVGRPLIDLLRKSRIRARVVPVTLTGGLQVTPNEVHGFNVPKRTLCAVLQLLLQSRRLSIASELPEAAVLTRELTTFSVKVTTAGTETMEAWRERDHDDLVLALAFACWLAERPAAGLPLAGGTRTHIPAVGEIIGPRGNRELPVAAPSPPVKQWP